MKESSINAFFVGAIAGLIMMAVLLSLMGINPSTVEKSYKNKAISLGYATNVIVLDKNGDYGLEFRWITNK